MRGLHAAIDQVLESRIVGSRQLLDGALTRLRRAAPDPAELRVSLHRREQELFRAAQLALNLRRASLAAAEARLAALNPSATLTRGYAIVVDASGRIVSSVESVRSGDALTIQLQDGLIQAETTRIERHSPEQSA